MKSDDAQSKRFKMKLNRKSRDRKSTKNTQASNGELMYNGTVNTQKPVQINKKSPKINKVMELSK